MLIRYIPIIETKNSSSYYIILLLHGHKVKVFILRKNWTLNLLNTHVMGCFGH